MENHRNRPLTVFGCALVGYFLLAYAERYWAGGTFPNPLWLATASTTAIAAIVARRTWPAVLAGGALGSMLAGFLIFDETARSLLAPWFGTVATMVISVLALPLAMTGEVSLRRTRRSIAWLWSSVLAALVGGAIATIESESVRIFDRTESMIRWSMGDVVGLLVLPPLVVAFRSPWTQPSYRLQHAETIATSLALAGLVYFTFRTAAPLPYILVPMVMWIAIRFGPRLSAPATLLTVVMTTYLTATGNGPFAALGSSSVLHVQVLNLAVALSSVVAGSHSVRAWFDQQRLRATLEALPDVIVISDSEGKTLSTWGPQHLQGIVATLRDLSAAETDDPLDLVRTQFADGQVIKVDEGQFLEQRQTRIDEESTLRLFRDVSSDQALAKARREATAKIGAARIADRQRLAMDLHDGPVQTMTAAQLYLGLARDSGANAANHLADAERLLADASQSLRGLLEGLSAVAGVAGLGDHLHQFGMDVLKLSGGRVSLNNRLTEQVLPGPLSEAILLVGREALMNSATHSGAQNVTIDLTSEDGSVCLVISDDGVGIENPGGGNRVHYGLMSMRTRAMELSGSLDVLSVPSEGTAVRLVLPVRPQADPPQPDI